LLVQKIACKGFIVRSPFVVTVVRLTSGYTNIGLPPPFYHAFLFMLTFLSGGIAQLFTPYHHRLSRAPMDDPWIRAFRFHDCQPQMARL
jgi:hypothetical protein